MDDTGTIGTGLVLTADHEINVVIMLNPESEEQVAVAISVEVAKAIILGLQSMVAEADLVSEAVLTMPPEAAMQYMENWAVRQRGGAAFN